MTNPNQLFDVLLFVCSKIADETNLSSKLPVADRTREVWGRKLCWWCLSSGFPLCTFLLGFADSFCFVFTSSPFYEASPLCTILCNLFPWLCWYVEVFKGGFEGVPVHLNCANFRRVCILCIPALFRTSVSGILSCHLIFRSFLRQFVWKWLSFFGMPLESRVQPQQRSATFVEIDDEIFSTVILSLPLIQEGQLSVSGERMCTILVNRLED